ncbi:hypothetical protein ABC345_21010 [Shouchella sp. 1P09AA]|uniref:hypothetical protein n=1 Tax=unclassified Shouchella TaxID=2893065 RepID=UPI0039A24DD1
MKNYQCKTQNTSLRDVINKFEEKLEKQDLVVSLSDGTCHIKKNQHNERYSVMVDKADISVTSTIEHFLK